MWNLAVGHHDFAHHEHAVGARGVGIDGNRFQHAIGTVALSLHGGGAVEAPQWELPQGRKGGEFLNLGFAAQIRCRRVSVEPDVLEPIFRHLALSILILIIVGNSFTSSYRRRGRQ
jgi:hypothetical protein